MSAGSSPLLCAVHSSSFIALEGDQRHQLEPVPGFWSFSSLCYSYFLAKEWAYNMYRYGNLELAIWVRKHLEFSVDTVFTHGTKAILVHTPWWYCVFWSCICVSVLQQYIEPPRLHLFNQNCSENSNIVGYYCNLRSLHFSEWTSFHLLLNRMPIINILAVYSCL